MTFVLAACHVDFREKKAELTILSKMKTLAQGQGCLLEFEDKKVRWSLSKPGTEESSPLSFLSASLCCQLCGSMSNPIVYSLSNSKTAH